MAQMAIGIRSRPELVRSVSASFGIGVSASASRGERPGARWLLLREFVRGPWKGAGRIGPSVQQGLYSGTAYRLCPVLYSCRVFRHRISYIQETLKSQNSYPTAVCTAVVDTPYSSPQLVCG